MAKDPRRVDEAPGTQAELFLLCQRCGAHQDPHHRHCSDCGAPLLVKMNRKAPLIAVLTAIALVLAFWLPTLRPASVASGPSPNLAGITVGQDASSLEAKLGKPDTRPEEFLWQGPDGKSHSLAFWEYGLKEGVADLTVTVLDGKVYQIGVVDGPFRTSEGLRIGDSIEKARALYGTGVEEEPIEGLVPIMFIKGGVVVKVVTEAGGSAVLAIGIEAPERLPMDFGSEPHEHEHHEPPVTTLIGTLAGDLRLV